MNAKLIRTLSWMSAIFVVSLFTLMLPQRAAADDYDPPGRVARLNYFRGSVSFQPAGETDWAPAELNRPLTTGDMLWVDDGARAEIQLGSATIRLSARTGFSFLSLDDRTVQIQLSQGALNIHVRRLNNYDIFEVDTSNQAFSVLQPGQYGIEASEDGYTTVVTVRSGQGETTGGGRTYTVNSGLSGTFNGTDSLQANIYRAGDTDEFDNWCQDRDRRYDGSQSARYVSPDLVGYEDLDDNGSWRSDREYGQVWMPRVSAGWAPYHDGHWAWISPWGWTWVDDAPWGYAPFHYGRWVNFGGNWGWVPGPIAVRPVYAPALVVFIGGPSFGFSLSIGGGGGAVGWFPLGPREVYVPSYRTSRAYVDRVNVTNTVVNVTTITNVYNTQTSNNYRGQSNIRYANRSIRGAVTAVPQAAFIGAQPVGRSAVTLNQRQIDSAPVGSRAEVAPNRNSVFGRSGSAGGRVVQPPPAVANRSVVVKAPPPPPPVPFESQQQQLASHPGQPLAGNEVQNLRRGNAQPSQTRVRQAPPGRPAVANSNPPGNQPGRQQQPNVGGPVPVNNAPPAVSERPDRGNRNQPPPSAAAPNVSQPAPPVKNAPPAVSERPDRGNRNQPPPSAAAPTASQPAPPVKTANPHADRTPKETPQGAEDRQSRDRQKKQDDQSAPR